MNKLKAGLHAVKSFASNHSEVILSGVAILGVAATGYFAFKAGFDTSVDLSEIDEPTGKEKAKVVLKNSWPAIATGGLTWGVIVTSGVISFRRNKALNAVTTAYAATSEMFNTYRRHAIERLGEKKEAEMRGEIAGENVANDPPSEEVIFNTGHGNYLFKDRISGRYFRSSIDYVRKQQIEINNWLSSGCEEFVSVNEWFDLLGLESLEDLADLGWNVDTGVHFEFDSCLSPDNEPCIVISYDVGPRFDFRTLH